MDPLGINPQTVQVDHIPNWITTTATTTTTTNNTYNYDTTTTTTTTTTTNHSTPPFRVDEEINGKLCLWRGDVSLLRVGAVVASADTTPSSSSSATQDPHHTLLDKGGHRLKAEVKSYWKSWKTGEVRVTGGYELPARYVIHTLGPKYNIKYHTASETALHMCYRRALQCAIEQKVSTVAVCVLNSPCRGYPQEQAAHIALRTVRRCLEKFGSSLTRVVMVVNDDDNARIYNTLLPLYFPRSAQEEEEGCLKLPVDLGNEFGEPVLPDRQIRIIDNPHHKYEEDVEGGEQTSNLHTSVSVGEHSFSHMEEDIDKQRLLGAHPTYATSDPETASMTTDLQHKQRYERLLRRAKNEDLSEVSGIGCLYQCGLDKFGRPIIIFVGKWFKFNEINLDKALLYLISLLDPLVKGDYIILYFHTITTTENHPSLSWIKQVYEILEYKYKKNLKAFYIVHPTLWTKIMTWWFTTFMAPQIKHKVHSVPGVEYLYDVIDPDQLEIPAYITEHDMTINGLRYYHPVGPASSS